MGGGRPLRVTPDLLLPAQEIEVDFARSGGPGGQNVNKVETKALLRFSIERSRTLSEVQKARLRTALAARITASGDILIRADRHRNRARNVEDARARLSNLLARGLSRPKVRRPSHPSRGSVERRLESKRRRSGVKRGRREEEA
jgi:ribosome-associated protein